MKPADDPAVDYRKLVREGYDRCSAAFSEARSRDPGLELAPLLERLAGGSRVLDVGCGSGLPIAAALAREHRVTGVDVSPEQIRRARENVPSATFLLGDAMSVEFPAASFDAVVSFYRRLPLAPRGARGAVPAHRALARPRRLSRRHGRSYPRGRYTEDDFFGVRMYWSNWSREDYLQMFARLGFELLETRTIGHGYDASEPRRAEAHPLLFARKPGRS